MTNNFIEEFQIPFYQFKISNWNLKQKQLLDFYNTIEENLTNTVDLNSNVYTDFFKEKGYIKTIGEILREDMIGFVHKSGSGSCKITNAWFQKYTKGCFHSPHNHGGIGYSSVCYIKYDENEHQPTRFISPFNTPDGFMLEYVPKDVSEGTMIVFPAFLIHYVLPTSSDKERVILSMNIKSSN